MDRAKLIEVAANVNGNYRVDDNDIDLEVGFLYGTAELITALTLGKDESYNDVREEIARQIDLLAGGTSYLLLPANGANMAQAWRTQ
jgi:hypothetical protein